MYRIMLTYQERGILHVKVMDFHNSRIVDFTLDELEREELDQELKQYITANAESIQEGKWEYKKR